MTSARSLAPGPTGKNTYLSVRCEGSEIERIRKVYSLPGLSPEVDFRVHNACIVNLERAIKERVFTVSDGKGGFMRPPQPEVAHFFGELHDFKCEAWKHLPSTTPIPLKQFVGMYTGRRRMIYDVAASSLETEAVQRRDSYLCAFVKAEKINFTLKADPAPRLIQPRKPRYNAAIGCYLKPIEHRVYKAINKTFRHKTVMKGLNAKEVGNIADKKWSAFTKPAAIGLDANRFDQHVSETALRWEHSVYKRIFEGLHRDKEFAKLLNWQVSNRGYGFCTDGKVRYRVRGGRCSGDMNTAMGNCLIMCALVWAYSKNRGIKVQLMNNGDDCVVFMESKHVDKFNEGLIEWFHAMGFNMKVEAAVYEFEKIVFCQTKPVWTPEGYVMVRDPMVAIAKDCVSIKPLDTPSAMHKYLTVLGEGGLSLTGGIPVWQDFYTLLGRCPKAVSRRKANSVTIETGMMMMARGMSRKYAAIHPRTRYSFWRAFNIDPDTQCALESYYAASQISWRPMTHRADKSYLPFEITSCLAGR